MEAGKRAPHTQTPPQSATGQVPAFHLAALLRVRRWSRWSRLYGVWVPGAAQPSRWLLRTIWLGYAIQFARCPPKFRGIHLTAVKAADAHDLWEESLSYWRRTWWYRSLQPIWRQGFSALTSLCPRKAVGYDQSWVCASWCSRCSCRTASSDASVPKFGLQHWPEDPYFHVSSFRATGHSCGLRLKDEHISTGPALRAVPIAPCLHESSGGSPCSLERSGRAHSQLPRRLAHTGSVSHKASGLQARCGLHRRLRQGLGGHVQRACSVRGLDGSPTALAHQLPRVAGSTPGLEPSQETLTRRACTSPYGQHGDRCVHQPTRWSTLPSHVTTRPPPPPLESEASEVASRHSYPGLAQPDSRRAVTSCAPRRMETPSPDGPADLATFWTRTGRPVRVPRDVALPVVLLPDRWNTRHGRTGTQLAAGPSQICISPSEPSRTDSVQGQRGRGADPARGTILAYQDLVPRADAPRDSPSLADSSEEGSTDSETGHLMAPASRPLETSCLVPRRDAEVLGDLPQEVVDTITSARAPSTRHAYALKWNLFVEWCSSHREDPRRCPIRVVLSFLQQGLERRLSPSTLKVYVAAIAANHDPVEGKSVGKHDWVVRFLRGLEGWILHAPPLYPLGTCP